MAAVMWTSLLLSLAPLLHLQAFTLAPEGATKAPPHPHTDTQIDDPVLASHSTIWPSWAPVGPTAGARLADSLDWFPGLRDSTLAPEETEKQDDKDEFQGTISDYTDTQGFNPLTRPTSPASVTAQLGSTTDSDQHQPRAQATDRGLLALDFPATQQRDILEGDTVVEEIGDELQDFTENLTGDTGTDTSVFPEEGWPKSATNETALLDCSLDTTATSCNTTDQSWSPFYPGDIISNQSQHPFLSLTPPLFVPLYSDWNSALATWGFAWEAHIYGLGSVFAAFGLISVLCLLGLPLRCPPGSPYFTLLHLFLLATGGTRAFSLLYDAYSHQDRLPALGSLPLSELPFPCLTSAFSVCFLLLSLRSRMHLSLHCPLSLSLPLFTLPRPCLLFFLSLMHFGAFLGSIALFHVFPSLPVLLLLPQGVFILLCLLLPCSFLLFYCLVRQDAKHIQRLSDGEGEVTGSSVLLGRPSRCPFAETEEWSRAAGAGVGGALCLLGCGGLQLYGMLHALGLGGVSAGAGFQPWPWWAYQLGCRLCEVGVCLSLSIIGTQPLLFCCSNSNSSSRTKPNTNTRPGSWERLTCASPAGGPSHPLPLSPILQPHYPWSLGQKEKQMVCDVISKRQSEALPLYTLKEPPSNGLNLHPNPNPHPSQTKTSRHPNLPDSPSPPGRPQAGVESQCSSQGSLCLDTDSTVDLRPPSPIDLSRSIDQALYSETLFPHSLFSPPRLLHVSSSLSLNSPGSHHSQSASRPGNSSADSPLYRTSSCGDVDMSPTRPPQPRCILPGHGDPCSPPECWWRGSNSSYLCHESLSGSSQGLFSSSGAGGAWSHPHTTRGQPSQSSLHRTLPHLSYHRRYRTLSSASQDSRGEGRLEGREDLSESRLLERDMAVQAEFVNVCRQIDALSVCSDTIDL
ncbi:proline-rich transmembrane protein 4-like [Coregonus clupeaformis]|uniref:proline-rich transmembrane protein 4-like n=1 Tax=Coregonus clupeaformis TaxID=59861 RepID=UPI001BE0260B|nr:proline-rich transmembrane protein 4-like [Coregonus clupeaformis]